MSARSVIGAVACAALLVIPATATAAPKSGAHRFGVIGHSFHNGGGEAQLEQAIALSSPSTLAFVVATGIKGAAEPCSDALYSERLAMFDQARRPVIVVPAASDWSDCKTSTGRPVAVERLNRLRELFFAEPSTLGLRSLPLSRLSTSSQYRSYAENAHWVVEKVLYATVNIPANNNHYRPEAGRNSEFEDRAVANRFWLSRLFALAKRKQLDAVVLFSEGDLKALNEKTGLMALLERSESRQDGFAPTRRQITTLAQKFDGKVLLIDSAALPNGAEPAIEWRGNLGHASVGDAVLQVKVTPGEGKMFKLEKP